MKKFKDCTLRLVTVVMVALVIVVAPLSSVSNATAHEICVQPFYFEHPIKGDEPED